MATITANPPPFLNYSTVNVKSLERNDTLRTNRGIAKATGSSFLIKLFPLILQSQDVISLKRKKRKLTTFVFE